METGDGDTLLHNCTSGFACRNIAGHFLCECALGMALNFITDQCEGKTLNMNSLTVKFILLLHNRNYRLSALL